MTTEFRALRDDELDAWDLVAAGPAGNLRQASWWVRPLVPYGMAFDVVGCFQDGRLVGGALLRSASAPGLPFALTDCFHAPVHPAWSDELAAPFLDAVHAVARKRRSLRVVFRAVDHEAVHRSLGAELDRRGPRTIRSTAQPSAIVALRSRSVQDVVAGFRQNARQSWRKGLKGPIEVDQLTAPADLAAAYEAFSATADRKGFDDLRPWNATEPLIQASLDRGLGAVFGARLDGRVVAAIYVTFVGSEAEYVYGGFLHEARDHFPNHVLQVAAIGAAIDHGMDAYDLGQLTGRANPSGVDAFKLSLGGTPSPTLDTLDWVLHPRTASLLDRLRRLAWGRRIVRAVRGQVVRRSDARSGERMGPRCG